MISAKGKILISLFVIALVGTYIVKNVVFKAPTPIEEKTIAFDGSAMKFKIEVAANADKWQDAIVGLEGTISSVDTEGAMMNETIFCQFKDPAQLKTVSKGQKLKLKARFIGYDDLLEEIKLDQCIKIP